MPDNNTPRRTFRCEDEVWIPAQTKAKAEGTNASDVIRQLLSEWLNEGGRQWMRTDISDEIVEAAAKAMALDQSAPNWMSEQEWDGIMPERYKEPYRRQARLALEAAAPHMRNTD